MIFNNGENGGDNDVEYGGDSDNNNKLVQVIVMLNMAVTMMNMLSYVVIMVRVMVKVKLL